MTRDQAHEFYNFSIPVAFKDVSDMLLRRIDILMIGYFFSSTVVGFYNISVLVATTLALPLAAFNQLFPPIASRLYAEGDMKQLDSLYGTVTRWTFATSLIIGLITIVYREEILSIFGTEFVAGSLVLLMITISQLFNCLGGANGYLLMMTNHQYIFVVNQWIFGILNVILNYALILKYGFVGAAVATASILILLNTVITIQLWYLEDLFPYSKKFMKPFTGGLIALIPLLGVSQLTSGMIQLAVGSILAIATYVGILYILGIERSDREFFQKIVSKRF
jgi:O-antigen/teichoic acid export membrane protein